MLDTNISVTSEFWIHFPVLSIFCFEKGKNNHGHKFLRTNLIGMALNFPTVSVRANTTVFVSKRKVMNLNWLSSIRLCSSRQLTVLIIHCRQTRPILTLTILLSTNMIFQYILMNRSIAVEDLISFSNKSFDVWHVTYVLGCVSTWTSKRLAEELLIFFYAPNFFKMGYKT